MKISLILFFTLCTLISCGKDDPAPVGSSSNVAMTSALSTISSTTNSAANLIGSSSSFVESQHMTKAVIAFGGKWGTAAAVSSLYNSGTVSIAKWMEDEFNPDFVNDNGAKVTFAGRIANALGTFCYMAYGNLPIDSTGLASVGTHSMTITTAMGTACGEDTSSMNGETISIAVTDTTDTTYYDKKFVITMPGSTCPFLVYARSNSTAINIATSEDQTCDGRDQASQTVFHYNKTTSKALFSYISQAFTGVSRSFEFYRGYLDSVSDVGYMLGIYGGDNSGTLDSYIAYSVVGKPVAGGTAAVSIEIDAQNGGSVFADGTYRGCINITGNTMATEDTLACTVTGVSVDGNATSSGAIKDAHAANTAIADIYNISETTTPGFTSNSNMY